MTRISGCFILSCPHCGALYRTPNYSSMNFMAMEAWTDGHQVYSLMPPSEYMRLCTFCDQLYDMSEASRISELTKEQMYDTVEEPAEPPRNGNPKAALFALELRLRLWQQGNDWYREGYLAARRSGAPNPPQWSLSDAQAKNLGRITELLQDPQTKSHDAFLLVDAYRELGEFDRAAKAMNKADASGGWFRYQKMLIEKRMSHVALYP